MSKSPEKIKVKCPQCEKTIRAPKTMAGKSGKCPACGYTISIPQFVSSRSNFNDDLVPPVKPQTVDELTPPAKRPTVRTVASVSNSAEASPTPESRPEPTQEVGRVPVGPDSQSSATGQPSSGSFVGSNWPTLVFWLPCAFLCLMAMLYGVVTVIAYNSGPSDMRAWLNKQMFSGAYLFFSGVFAFGVSVACVLRFCKRKNLAAKIVLYVGCLVCMLGAGFALLVFNQAWHTAWLVMLNIELGWVTWIIAWPLVALTVVLIIFHAIMTKAPATKIDQPNSSERQSETGGRKYWVTAAVSLALLIGGILVWQVFPIWPTSSVQGNTDSYQPKRVRIQYEGSRPKVTSFEEAAWIFSENYSARNVAMDQMVAREWLNMNGLNPEEQADLLSLVTPFLSFTEPLQFNRKLMAFDMIERYGGPEQIELIVDKLGSEREVVVGGDVLAFVVKHCKGTESEIVIDYLMLAFEEGNIMPPSREKNTDPKMIAEEGLVLIGDPVWKRHGAAIRSNDDPRFQRLAMRLNKLSGLDLARRCISEIGEGDQRHAVSYQKLRGIEIAATDHGAMAKAIIDKLNSYSQKGEIKDSRDQDAMISLAAILTEWGTAEQTLPIITKAVGQAKSNYSHGQHEQQFHVIFEFATKHDTPAAAELLVALLESKMEQAKIHQAIQRLGGNSKGPLVALINSYSPADRKLAERQGIDQVLIIEQCFADLTEYSGREIAIERLKSMEIKPANQALAARQVIASDTLYDLKEVYFQYAGNEEIENLKELAYSKSHEYRYPALKRLLEVDLEEGASRMKEIYLKDPGGLPLLKIEKNADFSFEPGLRRLLEDDSIKPTRDLLRTFEEIGTSKSLNALKSLIKRLKSETPPDKRARVRNGYLVETAQSAIKKINSRK